MITYTDYSDEELRFIRDWIGRESHWVDMHEAGIVGARVFTFCYVAGGTIRGICPACDRAWAIVPDDLYWGLKAVFPNHMNKDIVTRVFCSVECAYSYIIVLADVGVLPASVDGLSELEDRLLL